MHHKGRFQFDECSATKFANPVNMELSQKKSNVANRLPDEMHQTLILPHNTVQATNAFRQLVNKVSAIGGASTPTTVIANLMSGTHSYSAACTSSLVPCVTIRFYDETSCVVFCCAPVWTQSDITCHYIISYQLFMFCCFSLKCLRNFARAHLGPSAGKQHCMFYHVVIYPEHTENLLSSLVSLSALCEGTPKWLFDEGS